MFVCQKTFVINLLQMKPSKIGTLILALLMSSLTLGAWASDHKALQGIYLPIPYQVDKTCRYFENLAFADSHSPDAAISPYTRIAQNCISARDIRRSSLNGSAANIMAEEYLANLVQFRNNLIALNSSKFWRARNGEAILGRIGSVSSVSFFLIAKEHELFRRHSDLTTFYANGFSQRQLSQGATPQHQ